VAAEDERVVLLDGDVGNSTKAEVFASAHPTRFLQMGIAEQNMVGAAVGLAGQGFIPWLSSFTPFLTHRAIDPIRMLVAQTRANVKMAGAYAGLLTGATGRTHQDVEDLAILRAMPNLTVLSPGDAHECAAMTRWATETPGPVYVRVGRDPEADLFDSDYEFSPGSVVMLAPSAEITLVSTGVQSVRVARAAQELQGAGISVGLVHVPTIKPLDTDALIGALAGSRVIVSIEEHSVLGGLGGLVAELVAEAGLMARVHRIGLPDVWTESAPNEFLLDKYGLSDRQIVRQVTHLAVAAS
jgi:transketolase